MPPPRVRPGRRPDHPLSRSNSKRSRTPSRVDVRTQRFGADIASEEYKAEMDV